MGYWFGRHGCGMGRPLDRSKKKHVRDVHFFFWREGIGGRETAISFLPLSLQPIHSLFFTLPFLIFVPFINKLDKSNNKGRKILTTTTTTTMSEREAQELVAKADKKATSSSWFFGGNKYEEAAELYTNAGNIFKMAKRCKPLLHAHIGPRSFFRFFLASSSGMESNKGKAAN